MKGLRAGDGRGGASRGSGNRRASRARPGEEDRARRDHERGKLAGSLLREQREDLNGLAEAHVVGEAAAHTRTLEPREPAEALLLVRAQHALELWRRRERLWAAPREL